MKKENSIYDAVIIGAGPAGMMAAIQAGKRKKRVLLLEKNDIPGRKLLMSGKGRCNVTNNAEDTDELIGNFSYSGRFLYNAFHIFSNADLMGFFEKNNVKLKVERGRRVFPESDDSKDILKALMNKLKEHKIECGLNQTAIDVTKKQNTFSTVTKGGRGYPSKKVVMATGGLSYPETGSTGFGHIISEKFGHTIVDAKPGLVGVNAESVFLKDWQGISLRNVNCRVTSEGEMLEERFGEMIFTHYGLSGPIVLDLSSRIYDELAKGYTVHVLIDLKPALTHDVLDKRILRDFDSNKNKTIDTVLKGLVPKNMIQGLLCLLDIPSGKKINQISKGDREYLVKTLKSLEFKIVSTRPIEEAIVTRGGILTKEINPKTTESKLVKGLFFAGELIDVDAKTGGYNMQAAFSTGYAAGINI